LRWAQVILQRTYLFCTSQSEKMVDGNNISWRVTGTAVPMEVSNQFHQLNDESFRGTDWSPQKLTKRLVETGRSCRVHDSTVAGGFRRDAPRWACFIHLVTVQSLVCSTTSQIKPLVPAMDSVARNSVSAPYSVRSARHPKRSILNQHNQYRSKVASARGTRSSFSPHGGRELGGRLYYTEDPA
jgi:hypothetical protein